MATNPVTIDFDDSSNPIDAVIFSGQSVDSLIIGNSTVWSAPRSAAQNVQIGYFQGTAFVRTTMVFTPSTTTETRSLNLRFSANSEGDTEYTIAVNGTALSGTYGPDTNITLVYLNDQGVAQNGFLIPTDTNASEVNNITITPSMGGVEVNQEVTLILQTESTETETMGQFNVPLSTTLSYVTPPTSFLSTSVLEIGSTHKEVSNYILTKVNDDLPTGTFGHSIQYIREQGEGSIIRLLIQYDFGRGTNRRLTRTLDFQIQLVYEDGTLSETKDFTASLSIDTEHNRTGTLINRTPLQRAIYQISETDATRSQSGEVFSGYIIEAQSSLHMLNIGLQYNTLSIPSLGVVLAMDEAIVDLNLEYVSQNITYTFPAISTEELRTINPVATEGLPSLTVGLKVELAYQKRLTADQYALLPEAERGDIVGRVNNTSISAFNTPIARFFPLEDRAYFSTADYTTDYLPQRLHLMFTLDSTTAGLPGLTALGHYFALGFPDTLEVVASYT